MPNGAANLKLGVSGVSQFQQGMKQAQNAVKTLDAQLKLNEAQFRQTGDAETYMQQKSELLQKQIAEQKTVVEQAERALAQMSANGVDKSSASFQKMQQQLIRAKTDLTNMETGLNGVESAGAEAEQSVGGMNDQLRQIGMGVSFENITNGLNGITSKMEAAAKTAWNLGKRVAQATLGAGAWADDLATEASVWEIPAEELYRMRETARIIDTEAETILGARKKLTAAMGKESNQDTMGAFAALGIDPTKRHDDIMGVFWDAGAALMAMDDTVNRNEYAMRLFGKSFEDLIPLFSAGREEYDKTMESWTWVGDEQFESLTNMNDAEQKLTSEWEAFQRQFEAALAPTMTTVMDSLTALLTEFNSYLQSEEGQAMMDKLGEAISGLFEDLTKIDPESVMNTLKGVIDGITGGFQWLIDNKEDVVEALKWIVAGWATIKLTGGALDVLKVINGAKNLITGGGGGGAPAPTGGSPSAPTGGTGGGGGGWLKNLGIGALKVAPFALPFALGIGGIIDDIKMVQAAHEEGRKQLEEVAAKESAYGGSSMFGIWKTLTDYNTLSGGGAAADTEAAQAFAQEWINYINDRDGEIDDPQMLRLWEQLEGAGILEQFNESMTKLQNGELMYSSEEAEQFIAPIQRALELIEQDMATENAKPDITPSDLSAFRGVPAAIQQAVTAGMANAQIVIDSSAVDTIGGLVGQNMWRTLMGLLQ